MSGMVYSGSGTDHEIVEQGSALPGYVSFLVLLFQLIVTTVDLLLAGWVVYTIKITRSLHKPHNIFVANLLISGMISALLLCLISVPMIISFQLGVNSFITCFMLKIAFFPIRVTSMTFALIAADKVIAITLPLKYKKVMSFRAVATIISGVWLFALISTAGSIILNVDGVTDVPEFGACIFKGDAFTEYFLATVMPVTMDSILAITLNIYLAIVAYQIHKQIEKETRLSGGSNSSQSEKVTTLKRKQHNTRQNMKPVITLLVVIFGNVLIILVFSVLHMLGRNSSVFYQELVEYIIIPNGGYLIHLFNPLVYGLYFRQVRDPMMKHLRRFMRMNKINEIAPQP